MSGRLRRFQVRVDPLAVVIVAIMLATRKPAATTPSAPAAPAAPALLAPLLDAKNLDALDATVGAPPADGSDPSVTFAPLIMARWTGMPFSYQ